MPATFLFYCTSGTCTAPAAEITSTTLYQIAPSRYQSLCSIRSLIAFGWSWVGQLARQLVRYAQAVRTSGLSCPEPPTPLRLDGLTGDALTW